ncbi:MAG: NADH-quinone oxidoreductase subunit NuoE [Sedimentisphaerales bacterium]|nr:NADH-quinone oxidoreductase subunit NuoE [Sedimentisphaerales bacterium]
MGSSIGAKPSSDFKPLDKILKSMPKAGKGELIPLLQAIQNAYGYLPKDILAEMSRRTGIEPSTIYGVATFYEQFYLEPHGRHTVKCCRGTACHVKGSSRIIRTLQQNLGVEPGGTTEDMEFTFETVACLGACALAPVMVVDGTYYGKMTYRKVDTVLNSYRQASKENA